MSCELPEAKVEPKVDEFARKREEMLKKMKKESEMMELARKKQE